MEIIPDKIGRELDLAATLAALSQGLENYSELESLSLAEMPLIAAITAAYLESLNVREPIAMFSTNFTAENLNRNHNIKLAAKAIDKTLVLSDGQFSFNEVVGKATAQRGYREALVIVGGELVEGIGGGICQVSSTLYNAILLADLSILERRNHALAVTYLPPGRDATISYGWIDLKFLNERNHAVWLRTFIDGNKLTVTFYGKTIPGHEVSILTTDLASIDAEEEIIMTPDLPKGVQEQLKKGQPGYHVTVWRVTKLNGEEISREMLSQDSYRSVPYKYRVGTAQ
ncbi:MAG: Vancomycin B-type resistance protein VanW [Dehalococcoidia bacterium]|nr:Vancomycin B-type resistance protein VanW [Bacillota bacterium]MBT9141700.1 Vancomycin B-type resistance protein VanW [Bacillota bacterium]